MYKTYILFDISDYSNASISDYSHARISDHSHANINIYPHVNLRPVIYLYHICVFYLSWLFQYFCAWGTACITLIYHAYISRAAIESCSIAEFTQTLRFRWIFAPARSILISSIHGMWGSLCRLLTGRRFLKRLYRYTYRYCTKCFFCFFLNFERVHWHNGGINAYYFVNDRSGPRGATITPNSII